MTSMSKARLKENTYWPETLQAETLVSCKDSSRTHNLTKTGKSKQ